MLRIACCVLLLVACASRPVAGDTAAVDAPAVEYRNGRWFDGERFVERTFYVVGDTLKAERPANVGSVVDLAGGFVVPPFAEGHNHWLEPGAVEAYVQMYLRDGIFYLKDQANAPRLRERMARAVNRPDSVDMVSANQGFSAPGAHPMQIVEMFLGVGVFPAEWKPTKGDGEAIMIVNTLEDIAQRWPRLIAGRPDFVKVFLLYSEQFDQRKDDERFLYRRGLNPALVPEITKRAHEAGLRVSAHTYTAHDFQVAVRSGVDDIAHLPGAGYEPALGLAAFQLREEDVQLAARRGVTVTTTVAWVQEDKDVPAEARQAVIHNLQLLEKHGVPILIGSDLFRQTAVTEVSALASLGVFSNLELLRMWCETTPQAIFSKRRIGRLVDGYEASFLVLHGNPLDDLSETRRIRLRVKQGRALTPDETRIQFPQFG